MRTAQLLALLAAALVMGGCLSTVQSFSDRSKADDALYLENDHETAYRYYEKAARNGDAEAQHELAKMYRDGKIVRQDFRYAQTLEENAAAQNFAPAMRTLGFQLVNGLYGVAPAPRRGVSLLNAAAEDGDVSAHYLLGKIYAHGTTDIQKNAGRAAYHFKMADEAGDFSIAPEMKNAASIERMDLPQLTQTARTAHAYAPAPVNRIVITKTIIMDVQRALKARGFYASTIDGVIGKGSIKAIKAFQRNVGLSPTGVINDALLTALNLKHM